MRLRNLFKRPKVDQPAGLMSVLLDPAAPIGDRDDAAMDLGAYDEALPTLVSVISTPDEDEMIIDSCAESIWEIWQRTRQFDQSIFELLPKVWQDAVTNSQRNWNNAED